MRVGVIGRGFGERVVAAAFGGTEGCEVVEVVSPRDAAAVGTLCQRDDVDLISVHSPPFMHVDHVRQAVDAGHAVLCDKPFGRNAVEASQMLELARSAGVQHFLNFENRHDATRQKVRSLLAEGAVGQPEHVQLSTLMSIARPVRRFRWTFDAECGGGWLRALGSHLIDFTRWTFGEITEASGQLRTVVTERPDSDGNLQRCTADDGFLAVLRTADNVTAVIDSSSASPVDLPPRAVIVGAEGALEVEAESRITLHTPSGAEQVWATDGSANALFVAMQAWAGVVCAAVREGATPPDAATFADGLACNEVMDRIG